MRGAQPDETARAVTGEGRERGLASRRTDHDRARLARPRQLGGLPERFERRLRRPFLGQNPDRTLTQVVPPAAAPAVDVKA